MKQDKREKKRLNIVVSAAEVFSEKGYMKTKMSDVAVKASIGKGTIYEYFKSKEELFFEVFTWYNDKIFENMNLEDLNSNLLAEEKLILITGSVLKSIEEMGEFYSITLEFWSAVSSTEKRDIFRQEFLNMYDEFSKIIISILNQGIENKEFKKNADTKKISLGIIGLLDSMGLQHWLGKSFDLQNSGEYMVKTILKGIKYEEKK